MATQIRQNKGLKTHGSLMKVKSIAECSLILLTCINRPPDKSVLLKIIILISQPKHVMGTQKKFLNETVLLSIQNTC